MDNKKTLIASIIGVAMLVVLVVSATFAYFTTAVTNDDGETLVTGKTDAIGSISLTNPTSNLHITLNAMDMAQDNLKTYWATNDATLNYDSEEVQRDIAVATLTGGESTTHYECTTTINVNVSGTMVAELQAGDAYIQFGGLLTNKVDLKNVSSTGYPVTFALNGTDKLTDKVSVSLAIVNRNTNQNSIAGKELSVTFTNDDLDCKVVEDPQPTAFAIYSETDNSLRIYKNNDTVNVGDTYRNLKVTNIFTGFENSNEKPPWAGWRVFDPDLVKNIVIVDEIASANIKTWFNTFRFAETMDLAKLDVSEVTDMSLMFETVGMNTDEGTLLIGVENWDTSKVTNMGSMFFNSNVNLNSNINEWDTSNVTDMSGMFMDAFNIPDISEWDTSSVAYLHSMFFYANTGYTSESPLDLSGWDVSSVTENDQFIIGISPEGSIIPPNFGATS